MDEEAEDARKALDEGYLWLGRAISDFSRVEAAIGRAYRACFSFEDEPVAMHSYLAIRDTSMRQTMTSRAVLYALNFIGNPADLVERWRDAIAEAKRLSKMRNKLAHGSVEYTKTVPRDKDFRLYVLPYAHTEPYANAASKHLKGNGASPKGTWAAQNEEIPLKEVQLFAADCEILRRTLSEFSHDLEAALEQAQSDLSEGPTQPEI